MRPTEPAAILPRTDSNLLSDNSLRPDATPLYGRSAYAHSRQKAGYVMTSPLPNEPDVHLIVRLRGYHLHYAACFTAALIFVQDEGVRHRTDGVSVAGDAPDRLPRLPGERLYVER